MTHDEIIKKAAASKNIDFSGFINYFDGYGYDGGSDFSGLLVLDPPIGDITCLELKDLIQAIAGRPLRLQITFV